MAQTKYRNVKVNGYDSIKEMQRHYELQILERAGKISNLKRQVRFELIPHQLINGKVKERAVNYIADFTYTENGKLIVEDVKSPATRTPEYIIKRKLMLYIHGIEIKEV